MSISIIVPFYNEEDCLKECFKQITETFNGEDYELIFVNDGSTDKSHQIILEMIENNSNIKYVSYEKNRGYSGAVIEGFKMAKNDFVSFLDADLQYTPQDLLGMYNYSKKNNFSFAVGTPVNKKKYYNPTRKIMSLGYNMYLFILFGIKLKDSNSLKLMKRIYLERINFILQYGIMVEVEIILGFKMQGIPINTYPINVAKRIAGKSKFSLKTVYSTIIDCAKLKFQKNKLTKLIR